MGSLDLTIKAIAVSKNKPVVLLDNTMVGLSFDHSFHQLSCLKENNQHFNIPNIPHNVIIVNKLNSHMCINYCTDMQKSRNWKQSGGAMIFK